ncbi:MAG: pyridoxal phosphate-dependent aminotransferase [Candidatus Eisenbacteria bacterium]|uniref:Aminotransferase n=1 Tax=Eiseniibacteriota bacterium TaxID=2212470 RepID=A0A7Y2H113_UNCEI|nr:pyridoxal phosphate-dependent aminotransferase [Candidatus Eisenbacteria bacterium]
MPAYAKAMARLGTETAFEVLARARALEAQGRDIVHLEIGEPDFDTPKNIVEAGKKALDDGFTHYGPSAGMPEFRSIIANYIAEDRGISVEPENVVVTPGGKPVMFYGMLALLDPGDEVLYPNPGFPIYESVIDWVGAKAVPLVLRQENEFRLDLDEIKDKLNSKTKLLIINSPQNPTGGILPEADLKALATMLLDYPDCWILSDEIYSQLLYDEAHVSITKFPGIQERTIILDGFSKTYAMTGWRLGYGIMPEELATHVARLETNCNSCPPAMIQVAGMEALTGPQDEVDRMRAEFKKRRDHLVTGLNKIEGVECLLPGGAFYVFPSIKKLGKPSAEFATRLLDEGGVAALSGTAFGRHGEGHLRFSYANSIDNINKALERLAAFVPTL